MSQNSSDSALAEWETRQSAAVTGDPLWRLHCYREALFLIELARRDVKELGDPKTFLDARDQLLRSVASISANIGEGYSRPTAADRGRFFAYALGSARESVSWYDALRVAGRDRDVNDRVERLARVRRMLLALLATMKKRGQRRFDGW